MAPNSLFPSGSESASFTGGVVLECLLEVARPAAAQPQAGGRQLEVGESDDAVLLCRLIVFRGVHDEHDRSILEDDIGPPLPERHLLVEANLLGDLRRALEQPAHEVDGECSVPSQLVATAQDDPFRALGIESGRCEFRHPDQLRQDIPGHLLLCEVSNRPTISQEMHAMLWIEYQLWLHRRTFVRRHLAEREAPLRTYRDAVTTPDTELLRILTLCRILPSFITTKSPTQISTQSPQ